MCRSSTRGAIRAAARPTGTWWSTAGAHPNPRKAAEGYRLRRLALDEPSAEVVRRIFRQFLEGEGVRAIAASLNGDGIVCPSARRPDQNRHRLADGWQGSTVHAILENPRYTGYAVFGRWAKVEKLADPDDVAAGHVVRFERATPERIVRSRQPAHPAIVSVSDFTRVQVERRSRSSQGMRGLAERPRSGAAARQPYLLRGLVQCAICRRKMQGGSIRHNVYYRCTARRLAPGSAALAEHPKTVNLREDVLTKAINGWIGGLFSSDNRDDTVRALVESQGGVASTVNEGARTRLKDAEEALRRLQAAIVAGIDPAAVKEAINAAQAQREAARARRWRPCRRRADWTWPRSTR